MPTIRKRIWKTPSGATRTAWQTTYSDKAGKRHWRQFRSQAEAREWVENTNLRDLKARSDLTIADMARAWVARAKSQCLERVTIRQYRQMAETYIIPALGHVKLIDLSLEMVIEERDKLNRSRSESIGRHFVKFVKAIMTYAEDAGHIRYNVVARLRTTIPGRVRLMKRPVIPSQLEVDHLLVAINAAPATNRSGRWWTATHRRGPLFNTLMETGALPSEIRALAWGAIDWSRRKIEIRQRADRWNTIGPCKSAAAYRKIPISIDLCQALLTWEEVCPSSSANLVFPTTFGGVISSTSLYREFRRIQVAAGLTEPRQGDGPTKSYKGKYPVYTLRHLRASIWIAERINLKRLQTYMGHSSIKITFDTYGHLIAEAEEDAPAT